jgi:adenylate cyclase
MSIPILGAQYKAGINKTFVFLRFGSIWIDMHGSKKNRNISITSLLTLTTGGLVALSVSIVLALSVTANFRNTSELVALSANQLVNSIEQQVKAHVNPARYVVDHIAREIQSGKIDLSDKEQVFASLRATLAAAPNLTGVAVWRPDGHELQVRRSISGKFAKLENDNKNNQTLQRFLAGVRKSGKASWAEPVRADGRTFIAITMPVFQNGKYLGMVGAGISIADLSSAIAESEKETTMTSFILYGNDRVLAHRALIRISKAAVNPDTPLHKTSAIGDPVLAKFAETEPGGILEGKGYQARPVEANGRQFIIISRPFNQFGSQTWNIGVHAPRNELNSQLKRMFMSFVAGIFFLIASIIAAVLLAKKVARPIKAISKAATLVGTLDLEEIAPLPTSRISELNNQSRAFNQMLIALKWFEAYVPRKLVAELIRNEKEGAGQSRQEVLTVMFTDIIGFTALSENLPPSATAKLLNDHFEFLNNCIEKTDGTLDKYIGDSVMAFWGAPDKQSDHALRACETAMCIAESLGDESTLRIKISLHTGPLIVGNIGAKARMNYTVIGDTVNTASRIESVAGEVNKGEKVTVLMSEQTARKVTGKFVVEPAGDFIVKGRSQPVCIFRLVGRHPHQ